MTTVVLFLATCVLVVLVAAITAPIAADSDIPADRGPGRVVWVALHVPTPLRDLIPVCPPMHSHVVHADAYVEPSPLLYGRPPLDVTGAVRRVAA